MSVPESHRAAAGAVSLACAVLTASDTRREENDHSGRLMCDLLREAGHEIARYAVVREDPDNLRAALEEASNAADVILLNGGTGVSPRDRTVEVVQDFVERDLPGFGELFRMLSYQDIGSAAMLSRAVAGVRGKTVVFATPGSTAAVRLAMTRLIVPELRHLSKLLRG